MLTIKKLFCEINHKKILQGINLTIKPGEIHVLMGPNGSGKSTLAKAIMGHPDCQIHQGAITLDGRNITTMAVDQRAKKGIFVAFQYPIEIPGVNLRNFLRLAYNARQPEAKQLPVFKFKYLLQEQAKLLKIPFTLLERNLNEGMSGGEKKKCEILQLAILLPKYAVLDETDSGLDIDALAIVFKGLKKIMHRHKKMGILIITHYHRVFDFIKPEFVHIISHGQIVESGDKNIITQIAKAGYHKYQ